MDSLAGVRLRLDRVRAAVREISPAFLDTPAPSCLPLGRAIGCEVTLKVETLNPVRCFKGRGTETVAAAACQQGASRLVCASAGNLGQALAYSGANRGLAVTVVAARTANPLKLRQIAALGAEVRLDGEDIEDARLRAREIAEARRAYLVEDSLDLATCEGAGRSRSNWFETIPDSTSCSWLSVAELWPAAWATSCVHSPRTSRWLGPSPPGSLRWRCLGTAAILEDPERFAGRRVTTILCGSNVVAARCYATVFEVVKRWMASLAWS